MNIWKNKYLEMKLKYINTKNKLLQKAGTNSLLNKKNETTVNQVVPLKKQCAKYFNTNIIGFSHATSFNNLIKILKSNGFLTQYQLYNLGANVSGVLSADILPDEQYPYDGQYTGIYMTPLTSDSIGEDINYEWGVEVRLIFSVGLLEQNNYHINKTDSNGFIYDETYSSKFNKQLNLHHQHQPEIIFHDNINLDLLEEIWVGDVSIKKKIEQISKIPISVARIKYNIVNVKNFIKIKKLIKETPIQIQTYIPNKIYSKHCDDISAYISDKKPNYCYTTDGTWYDEDYPILGHDTQYKYDSSNLNFYKQIALNCGVEKTKLEQFTNEEHIPMLKQYLHGNNEDNINYIFDALKLRNNIQITRDNINLGDQILPTDLDDFKNSYPNVIKEVDEVYIDDLIDMFYDDNDEYFIQLSINKIWKNYTTDLLNPGTILFIRNSTTDELQYFTNVIEPTIFNPGKNEKFVISEFFNFGKKLKGLVFGLKNALGKIVWNSDFMVEFS